MPFSTSIPIRSNNNGFKCPGFKTGAWGLATGLFFCLVFCHSSRGTESNQTTTSHLLDAHQPQALQSQTSQLVMESDRLRMMVSQIGESEQTDQQLQEDFERQQELERQVQQELVDFTSSADSIDIIVLGQPQNAPYVVVIPGDRFEVLRDVQEIAPTAFITTSRRGRYIHAASFAKRRLADAFSSQLRYLGFDAQVTYMRVD